MPSSVEDNLPASNEEYGTREYWEQRYINEPQKHFDWFLKPEYLLPIFQTLTDDIGKDARILMLGCGNSKLGEVMYDAGWKNIVNIDYSQVVIDQMKERNAQLRPEMEWLVMDILDLDFETAEFDLVVDKGTMDAMLTTKGDPWNPPQQDVDNCMQEVDEGVRVLRKRKGSKFVYFTFGPPHFRKRYFEKRPGWKLTHREIGPPEGFAYNEYLLEYVG